MHILFFNWGRPQLFSPNNCGKRVVVIKRPLANQLLLLLPSYYASQREHWVWFSLSGVLGIYIRKTCNVCLVNCCFSVTFDDGKNVFQTFKMTHSSLWPSVLHNTSQSFHHCKFNQNHSPTKQNKTTPLPQKLLQIKSEFTKTIMSLTAGFISNLRCWQRTAFAPFLHEIKHFLIALPVF